MSTRQKLPIGISDFQELREKNYYFVDKSLFIKEIIDRESKAVLLPRPRRFGKTLNITMLRWFFEIAKDADAKNKRKELFAGLKIEQESVFSEHFAKYPVVYLTFKDVNSADFKIAYSKIKSLISQEFSRHDYLAKSDILNESEKKDFRDIIFREADRAVYEDSLRNLTKYLHEYHKKEPIVLIDEYDTPVHSAFQYGYFDDCISFFKGFLGAGLKDNTNIFKSVITGILRIARESIFSELNNLKVYSLLRSEYKETFGFTEKEVRTLLADHGIAEKMEDVKHWYDGYIFGGTLIYNPWSVINFVSSEDMEFIPYWANTSSNEILRDLIKDSSEVAKEEFSDLLKDLPVTININENIVLRDISNDRITIYSFLLFTGYLKAYDKEVKGRKIYYKLLLPNFEIKEIFEDAILKWINESKFENEKLQIMLRSLVAGDIETFEYILSTFVLETLSYFDTAAGNVEKVYQAFILGMLVNLSNDYDVTSEKESGFGRYDVAVVPKDKSKLAIIMEFKTINEFKKETKDQALESAMEQLNEKKYETAILKQGIENFKKLAVVFDKKRCWIKESDKSAQR